jgi:dTDP-4-dehydrorhamnose 3,5-epimerase
MKAIQTDIEGVLILEPRVFGDARGFFMESFNARTFNELVGHEVNFVQDNHSRSAKGVLRGLHFQKAPHAQGKLVRVTAGRCSTWRWTSERTAPPSAAGWGWS